MDGSLSHYTSKDDHESNQPLLEEKLGCDDDAMIEEQRTQKSTLRWRIPSFQTAFNILALLYILSSLPTLLSALYGRVTQPYSPLNGQLTYERQPLHRDYEELLDQGFIGRPEDTTESWRRLLEPMNFRATKEQLDKANIVLDDNIVKVSGGGYVGVLSVYHELHCLDALRRSTLRKHYYPNMTSDHDELTIHHLTHCIEYIRRTVMCHADVSMYAAVWIADSHELPNKDLTAGGQRQCVKWDAVDSWSRKMALESGVYKVKPGPYEKNLRPDQLRS